MNNAYQIITENLLSKLNLIDVSDEIKRLYYHKIKLLENEIKFAERSNIDFELETKIRSLDNELNSLIITSRKKEQLSSFMDNKLKVTNKKYSQNSHKLSQIKVKLITYLLTLSVMLTSSIYIVNREKNKTKELSFKTDTYTYYNEAGSSNYSSAYLPKTDSEALLIKRITPWTIEGKQGKRTIYTYKISNMSINDILNCQDFESITNNLDFTTENEYKYKNELRDDDRYEEPIYRIVYQTQDHNDYIVNYPNINSKIVAIVLCNLLIYILMVKINNGPLIESLLIDIEKLHQSDKQLDIDYQIIKTYKRKHQKNIN